MSGDPWQFLGQPLAAPTRRVRSQQAVIQVDAPPPGQGLTFRPDASFVWRPLACIFSVATSGAAAQRYVTVEYRRDTGLAWCINAAAVTLGAGETDRFLGSASRGVAEWNTGTDVLFPLQPLYLHGGDVLVIAVANIDAGDQLSSAVLVFDRVFCTYPAS